jgi:hypothetical protein
MKSRTVQYILKRFGDKKLVVGVKREKNHLREMARIALSIILLMFVSPGYSQKKLLSILILRNGSKVGTMHFSVLLPAEQIL